MATAFEDLRSEDELRRRAREALLGYATDLPVPARGAPPPSLASRNLDVRPPPPLPIVVPSPALAPHNPNPPGGGPYNIRPGEKIGEKMPTMQLAQAGGLPPGYSEIEPAKGELPPGYSEINTSPKAPPAPQPVNTPVQGERLPASETAGQSTMPEDPFERAAIRQSRYARPEARQGGGAEPLQGAINLAEKGYKQFDKFAEQAIKAGDLSPEDALNVAMTATPPGAAYRTGMAVARAAASRPGFGARNIPEMLAERQAAAQQLETGVMAIPRGAAGGETAQTTARALSTVPVIGSGIRQAANKSTEQLLAAGEAASARPTGVIPSQNLAGSNVRRGLESLAAQAEAEGTTMHPALRSMLSSKSNEDMIGQLARFAAEVKSGANVNALAQARKAIPTGEWANVQGALIERMGQSPSTGAFDAKTWIRNYGGLSERAKNIMFGYTSKGSELRIHLDALEGVARRAPTWEQLGRERSSLGSVIKGAGLLGASYGFATQDPLTILQTVLPLGAAARYLSRPATAAPIAQWSRAYERMARSGGTPQALAAFKMATDNMANSLGIKVSVGDFLGGSKDGQPVE